MNVTRCLPFGYCMKLGKIVIDNDEADTVRRIYDLYGQGNSYLTIAKALQSEGIPYIGDLPRWNKNNVKRILENENYTGAGSFPPILTLEVFQKARDVLQEKPYNPTDDPTQFIWKRLVCHECGARMKRKGGKPPKGMAQLRCEGPRCGNEVDIRIDALYERMREAASRSHAGESPPYTPTARIMRIENEINRHIDKPADPAEARRLILQGATARYRHWSTEYEVNRPLADWQSLKRAVSYISISADHRIYLTTFSQSRG